MILLLQVGILLIGVGFCGAAVKCECMARAVDGDGTIAAYIIQVDLIFGTSRTCKICNQKCEKQINSNTKHGDLHSVPFRLFNRDKLGTLICKHMNATSLKSAPVQLYSVCNGGQPELCNFSLKTPGYICCQDNVWPEANAAGACPGP